MLLSIITPTHETSCGFLDEAWKSLLRQTHTEWEWILIPNNGGEIPPHIQADEKRQVLIYPYEESGNSIGALKHFAAKRARGEVIVELDADDLLTDDALGEVARAFENPDVTMTYSNHAEFWDESWTTHVYGAEYGWKARPFYYDDHELMETVSWPPSAHMMRHIYWAPNHLRAWRREAYWEVGGHDPQIPVGDDHDLCCRFYLRYGAKGIKHIDRCLYLYRLHDKQSYRTYNAPIQEASLKNYLKYSRDLATRWARDEGLRLVELGGRFNAWQGYETVDLLGADITADLEQEWPFEDNSVGILRASHIFEHLRDPIHTMNEAHRVLAPGGWLFIDVPSTDGRGAFQDPTHISFWNQNSIWYYTNRNHARFIQPRYTGRFQASRVVTFFPTDFDVQNNISIVQADLICLKPPYDVRPVGEVFI